MKGLVIGIVLGGILVFTLLAIIGISMNNQNLTGNVINTPATQTQQSNQEQTIIDNKQLIKENMYYSQTFEVFRLAKVYINITSDDFVNYALLPDYEVDHYTKGESYKSYANLEGILFVQDTYNLNAGKYSVIITSADKLVNVHLIVKAI